jgi:16S rRNA G1207 methylase RsmC
VSPASITLSQLTPRNPVGSVLDLGTGCGVQSLSLSRQASRVVATDVNRRALEAAQLTFALSGVEVDLREGNLYEPVAGERFDLIVTNPPFVISPPGDERLTYRETDQSSDDFIHQVIRQSADHLTDDGRLVVLGNWAHTRSQAWTDRLAEWIPPGTEALVLEREVLDAYEYIEVWLADAGLAGDPSYPDRFDHWLNYFDSLDIESVGMG